VIKRLIAVADSRFQDELVKQAKAHGKLEASYQVPERYRRNLPEACRPKNCNPGPRPAVARLPVWHRPHR
jgi:hypothetical protein